MQPARAAQGGGRRNQEEVFQAAAQAITNALQGQSISPDGPTLAAGNTSAEAVGSGQSVALPTSLQQALAGPPSFFAA